MNYHSYIFLLFALCCGCTTTLKRNASSNSEVININLTKYVLPQAPSGYENYESWIYKYPHMADLKIRAGYFSLEDCQIAIEDGNRNGVFNDSGEDFIHLLKKNQQYSDWLDLCSTGLKLSENSQLFINGNFYYISEVDANGGFVKLESKNEGILENSMFFNDEVSLLKLTIPDLYGNEKLRLEDYFNKGHSQSDKVVISFWNTWCEPCAKEIPTLNEITKYAALINIVTTEDDLYGVKRAVEFSKMKGLQGVTTSYISRLFCQNGIPDLIVVDEKGHIVKRTTSAKEVLKFIKTKK